MSNVWSAIAFAAPCAVRRTRSKPLVHLFNAHARYASQCSRTQRFWLHPRTKTPNKDDVSITRCRTLSTSSHLKAKLHNRPNPKRSAPSPKSSTKRATPPSESKLQPAPTVASHTEGIPPEAEEPLTWRDYDPEGGMPLPRGELSQPEINAVFNSEQVDADMGNYILSVMHWRRQSGALIDVGLEFPPDMNVNRDMALRGLQHVRQLAPDVDEYAAGQQWAEEEIQRKEQEIQARSVKLGFYKADPQEQDELEAEPEEEKQGTEYGREKTGDSVLRRTREANEAAWEVEKAAREAKQQRDAANAINAARGPLELAGGVQPYVDPSATAPVVIEGPFGIKITKPNSKAWLQPVERKPWVKYYENQAYLIKEQAVPQLSTLRRLGPPFLVLLAVLAGCYYLSENYTPPPRSARVWPDLAPSAATLTGITGVLVATFLAGRMPPLWKFYSKYMTMVPAWPISVSLVGSLFRHDTLSHFATNIVGLWIFGLFLHEQVGRGTFLAVYLAAGVGGAYGSLLNSVLRKQWEAYIFGASGSIFGVWAAACALKPNAKLSIYGYEIPIAAWVFIALFGAMELYPLATGISFLPVDFAGHVGGLLTGGAIGLYLRQKAKAVQMTEMKSSDVVQQVR